jgi:hypothetical protein
MPSKLISPIRSKPERIVFPDASSFAGAGFVELNGKHTVVHYMWKNEEVNKSSTWCKMKAIFIILQSISLFIQQISQHLY